MLKLKFKRFNIFWISEKYEIFESGLEEIFSITFETDDIIDFSSYKKGQDILSKKYKVNF